MDEPGGHYAKWNKPGREIQLLCGITYTWTLKKKTQKKILKYFELNENENTTYQNVLDTVKAVLRRKFIAFKSLC